MKSDTTRTDAESTNMFTFDLDQKLKRYTVKFDFLLGGRKILEHYCHRVFARLVNTSIDFQRALTLKQDNWCLHNPMHYTINTAWILGTVTKIVALLQKSHHSAGNNDGW